MVSALQETRKCMWKNPSWESRVWEGFPEEMRMSSSEDTWGQRVLSMGTGHAKALRWEGAWHPQGAGRGSGRRECSARVRVCRICHLGPPQWCLQPLFPREPPLPSPQHKEPVSPWKPGSKVSRNIINIPQRETCRLPVQEDRSMAFFLFLCLDSSSPAQQNAKLLLLKLFLKLGSKMAFSPKKNPSQTWVH